MKVSSFEELKQREGENECLDVKKKRFERRDS